MKPRTFKSKGRIIPKFKLEVAIRTRDSMLILSTPLQMKMIEQLASSIITTSAGKQMFANSKSTILITDLTASYLTVNL